MKWIALRGRRAVRVAQALWLVLTVFVWNVVFDAEVIAAGRRFLKLVDVHEAGRGPAVRIDEVMRPAQTTAFLIATLAAAAVLVVGWCGIALAQRRMKRVKSEE